MTKITRESAHAFMYNNDYNKSNTKVRHRLSIIDELAHRSELFIDGVRIVYKTNNYRTGEENVYITDYGNTGKSITVDRLNGILELIKSKFTVENIKKALYLVSDNSKIEMEYGRNYHALTGEHVKGIKTLRLISS